MLRRLYTKGWVFFLVESIPCITFEPIAYAFSSSSLSKRRINTKTSATAL